MPTDVDGQRTSGLGGSVCDEGSGLAVVVVVSIDSVIDTKPDPSAHPQRELVAAHRLR